MRSLASLSPNGSVDNVDGTGTISGGTYKSAHVSPPSTTQYDNFFFFQSRSADLFSVGTTMSKLADRSQLLLRWPRRRLLTGQDGTYRSG